MAGNPIHRRSVLIGGLAVALPAWADGGAMRLLLVEKPGCVYCAAWDRYVAPGYAQSPEGRRAPLMRVHVDGPYPDGLVLGRRPFVTPTFILLVDSVESGRIEGYPGRDRFHPMLADLIKAGRAG